MNADAIVEQLAANRDVFTALIGTVGDELARFKPAPDRWSILEVVCHLYDEERDDFRKRLALVLRDPAEPWPPINPAGWVAEREYAKRDLRETLADFLREREASLKWLRTLSSPAWDNAQSHPAAGSLSAGDLLASWLAHDLLHIRQITRLNYDYAATVLAGRYRVRYAGEW